MGAREHGSMGAGAHRSAVSSPTPPRSHAPEPPCLVIGLVGGIGSGKTAVAQLFAELGARVLDADAICTELHKTPEIRTAIESRWGRAVFRADGELDRAKLGAVVFADPRELEALDNIMHPHVIERIKQDAVNCRAPGGPGMCVIDAPLLLESGLDRLCDVFVFV